MQELLKLLILMVGIFVPVRERENTEPSSPRSRAQFRAGSADQSCRSSRRKPGILGFGHSVEPGEPSILKPEIVHINSEAVRL